MNKMGFTFIELMLVIVLIAVIVVLAVPRIRSTFTSLEIYNFARKTSALMRFAQSKAIAEGEKIYFIYEPAGQDSGGSFFLAKDDLTSLPKENKKIIIDERFSLLIPTKIEVEFKTPPNQGNNQDNMVVFNPDGSIEGSPIIISSDTEKFQINAEGVIGRVKVEELSD